MLDLAIPKALILIGVLAGSDTTPKDKVELVSGEVFYGHVLRQNEDEVSIQLESGGILSFRRSQVRHVRAKDAIEPAAGSSPSSSPVLRTLPDLLPPGPGARTTGLVPPRALPAPRVLGPPALVPPPRVLSAPSPPLPSPTRPAPSPAASPPGAPETPAGPQPLALRVLGLPVTDAGHGFTLLPPAGFIRIEDRSDPDLVLKYRDPVDEATMVISAYVTTEPLIDLKKKLQEAYLGRTQAYRIEQDIPLAGREHESWLVEVTAELGSVSVRRLQLLARCHDEVLILTYTTTSDRWARHGKAFDESARSLRVIPRQQSVSGAPELSSRAAGSP